MKSFIILCGGRGKRMGQDKGLMLFQEKPMILHVLGTVFNQADEIILVLRDENQFKKYEKILKDSDLKISKIRVSMDFLKDQGPLVGICTGLMHIKSDEAMVVPCDSPFITPSFIEKLYSLKNSLKNSPDFYAIVPRWSDGMVEPLHAIYSKENVKIIQDLLKKGKRDVNSLLKIINVRYVEAESLDESGSSLKNLNKPEDIVNVTKELNKRKNYLNE